MTWPVRVRPDVAEALADNRPVVALESTLIVHGLARPRNLEVAARIEDIIRSEGAVPATIGIVDGTAIIGLSPEEIERLCTLRDVPKVSVRDLGIAVGLGANGATTVASTAVLAARAGIAVFATGGLGGVHRDARETWDESADLLTLSRAAVTVVSAGVKSILDVGATLERLESLSVAVVGFRTQGFPGFYLSDSGHPLDWTVDSVEQVAEIMAAQRALEEPGGLVVGNPIPVEAQLDPALHDRVLTESLEEIKRRGIRGKAVTPFLLEYFHQHTGEASLAVNIRIIERNVELGARIARAWCARAASPSSKAISSIHQHAK